LDESAKGLEMLDCNSGERTWPGIKPEYKRSC